MRRIFFLAASALGLTATAASAQPTNVDGFYLGAAVAQQSLHGIESGDGTDIDFDSGSVVRGQVGYRFGSWRAETEVAYEWSEFEDDADDEFDADVFRGAVSLFRDFAQIPIVGTPSPYIGGGIGIANIAIEGDDVDDDETGVTFHGEIGLTFQLTDRFALMPQYRFQWFDTNDVADVRDNLYTNAFGVGGRFYF